MRPSEGRARIERKRSCQIEMIVSLLCFVPLSEFADLSPNRYNDTCPETFMALSEKLHEYDATCRLLKMPDRKLISTGNLGGKAGFRYLFRCIEYFWLRLRRTQRDRLWPCLPIILRKLTKPYKLPGKAPLILEYTILYPTARTRACDENFTSLYTCRWGCCLPWPCSSSQAASP